MSAAGCQTGTPVLCRAHHNGTPEHTTGTGFTPERVTNEAPVAMDVRAEQYSIEVLINNTKLQENVVCWLPLLVQFVRTQPTNILLDGLECYEVTHMKDDITTVTVELKSGTVQK